jgi:hypothetical protein
MSEIKETVRPRFFTEAVQDKAASEKENRPIFATKRFVELKQPGDRLWSFVEQIDENGMGMDRRSDGGEGIVDYAARFPREFAAFKRGEERAAIGTPVDEWTAISRSRAAELKAMNVFTVEEYAGLPDNLLQKMGMGSRAEREKARAFLASASEGAETSAMATRLAELEELVARLTGGAPVAAATPTEPQEKALVDCTDDELKAFIKRETGSAPKGTPSRETLLAKAGAIAKAA